MGELNMVQSPEDDVEEAGAAYGRPKWMLAKSLLDVNDACSRTLESLLLQVTRDDSNVSDEELRRQLEDVIHRHEQLVNELELAREALEEAER